MRFRWIKKVETVNDLELFNDIWKSAWKEKGFEMEAFEGEAERYLFLNTKGEAIGTIEFVPYQPNRKKLKLTTVVEDVYP